MTEGFCGKCRAESSDESSGSFKEGLFGHEFKGEARRCADCGSYVTVLWKVFAGFPFKPRGCYRYILTGANMRGMEFLSRRVPDDKELIHKTRLMGFVFMVAVTIAIAAYEFWKRHR